jgi:hypothetical protein
MAILTTLPVGSLFLLGARVASRSVQQGIGLTLYAADKTPVATLQLVPDLTITGLISVDPATIGVTTITRPFAVGDVVTSDVTGETMVVRASWVDVEGFFWSNTTDRSPVYSTRGWTAVGTATLA